MATAEQHRITIEQVGLKYGLILGGANTGFFLLMAAFGWADEIWLRFINLGFIFLVAYKGLQYFKHHTSRGWTYLKGMGLGVYILLTGGLIFSVFLIAFGLINSGFIANVDQTTRLRIEVNPFVLGIIAFLETILYGFIMVFAAMQRLKGSHMNNPVNI